MDDASVGLAEQPESPQAPPKPPESVGGISAGQLRSLIERIERLEEDKAAIAADMREVFAEAKANGFDPKIMRQVLKIRKTDPDERAEQEELLDIYLRAVGMKI